MRKDAPRVAPRPRPDAEWVLRTGQALKAHREERGLRRDELAKRARTTAASSRSSRKERSSIRAVGS